MHLQRGYPSQRTRRLSIAGTSFYRQPSRRLDRPSTLPAPPSTLPAPPSTLPDSPSTLPDSPSTLPAKRKTLACALLLLPSLTLLLAAQSPQSLLEAVNGLRTADTLERQHAEVELRRLGDEALFELAEHLEDPDPEFRARVNALFSELQHRLLDDLEREHLALRGDRTELEGLQQRQADLQSSREFLALLEKEKARDAEIDEKVRSLLRLEEIETLIQRTGGSAARPDFPGSISQEVRGTYDLLRQKRDTWRQADPTFDARLEPLLKLARRHNVVAGSSSMTELETMRIEELTERVDERQPKLDAAVSRVERIGVPAFNAIVGRRRGAAKHVVEFYDSLVEKATEAAASEIVPPQLDDGVFDVVRYHRGLLWGWLVDARDDANAKTLLERHTTATLADLSAPNPLTRDRAADEFFLLGPHGLKALASAGAGDVGNPHHFLYELLVWRIRPRTYARTGVHFGDYRDLPFRKRRQKLFDYARVARHEAVPTLRAIVTDDKLESSFFVKLAAAKALAGLRDLSGYNYLVAKHPSMTMKRPEVSRDLLIIQGYEFIRDKQYQRAVEELQKVLDEFPFDFRANYHIAFAYLLLKNYGKSIHHFEIARRVHPSDQLTLYNLACAYSLGDKVPEALEALEESVEAGFDDDRHIENDPDLENLRQTQGYKDLLERMRAE